MRIGDLVFALGLGAGLWLLAVLVMGAVMTGGKPRELTNVRFGRLTALCRSINRDKGRFPGFPSRKGISA